MELSAGQIGSFLMYRLFNLCGDTVVKTYFAQTVPMRNFLFEDYLKNCIHKLGVRVNRRIALSCGIDSAILAKYMPKGSIAYIFKWVVSGIEVTGETKVAKQYADKCELEHKIIERYWEDFEKYAPLLMKHKKAPLQAKKDEIDAIVFGEAVDSVYVGLSGLLSKDWTNRNAY